jgi:hypothetical protein
MEMAPEVSRILARELKWDEAARIRDLEKFLQVAQGYVFAG